jgi:S-adenosylmethionine/arginine decarboxylase-like enzyme
MANIDYKNIEIDGTKYYGKHMMLTLESCNDNILSVESIKDFLKEMADEIKMIRYGEPIAARFGEGIEVGISAVQLITTSALTIHTNDAARDMYLDVFSCKWFEEETVIGVANKYFSPKAHTFQIVIRK